MFTLKTKGGAWRRRSGIAVAGVATAALALAGCSGGGDDTTGGGGSDEEQVLTVAVTSPPVSLDPYLQNVDPQNNWFINLAYDGLIRIDPEGQLEPDLATEWEFIDDENRQLEVTLRDDVTFSDGEELTAEGVVASLQYAQEVGVNTGSYWGPLETIEVSGENKVLFTSSAPNPSLPTMLTNRVLLGSVVSPAALDDPEGLKSGTFGAGPYILDTERTVANDTYYYTPNDTYWAQDKIHWDEVVLKVVPNANAAYQAVLNGEADLMRGDNSIYDAAMQSDLHVELVDLGLLGVNYIDRNGEIVPELGNPEVRKALNYAIDGESITKAVVGDSGVVGEALALNGSLGYTEEIDNGFPYDPEKAKQILADEGVTDLTFDVAVDTTSPNSVLLLQAVVANWADIGVNVNLVSYSDRGQAVSDILAKKYPVAYYGYGELTAYTVMNSFFGEANQYNPWGPTDEKLNALIDASYQASPEEQQDAVAAVYEYAQLEQAYVGGVLHSAYPYVSNGDRITGTAHAPLSGTPDIAWYVVPVE